MLEVKTKYTKESLIKFHRFHLYGRGARGVFFISFLILISTGALSHIYWAFSTGEVEPQFLFNACFAVALVCVFALIPRFLAKSAMKKDQALNITGYDYVMHDDCFTITTNGEMISGASEIKYTALSKVYEKRNYFYLYFQQNRVFIIEKKHFTQGTPEEFALILDKALPEKKFKKKKR